MIQELSVRTLKIFRRMADRKRLEDTTKKNIINTAYEEGLIVTDHGDGFSVIEESVMLNYRKVTERVLEKILLRASKSKK